MLPPTLPQTKDQEKLRVLSRGVAAVTASKGAVNFTNWEVKARSKIALAPKAGLKILCPRPPKAHLTKAIANTEPTMGTHQATVEGRIKPTKRPVTAALPSPKMPRGVRGALRIRASVRMALRLLSNSTLKAGRPKKTKPAITAGVSAMSTSIMICLIVKGLRRNGPVLICMPFTPNSLFPWLSQRLSPLYPA